MKEVTTIGLDLAKVVFQVHGADTLGTVTLHRTMRRRQVLGFFAAKDRGARATHKTRHSSRHRVIGCDRPVR